MQPLGHAIPLLEGVDAHHVGVALEQAWARPEHHPSARLMVELNDPVRDHQGVVIGQRDDAEPKFQVLRAFRRRCDE